jgi:hypothetical protein
MFPRLASVLCLCLVALFTSTALALPVGPFSEHDLSLVASQEGNPQRELFCSKNPEHCQQNFPEYCTDPNSPKYPGWCAWSNPDPQPPAKNSPVDSISLVARQNSNPHHQMFCEKNPRYCQQNFPEECRNVNGETPSWCHYMIPGPHPPIETVDGTTIVARQEGNPQRELFCHYNQPDCQTNHPEYCTDPNSPTYPPWCAWNNPDPQPPDKNPPVDSTTIVARQNPNDTPEEIYQKRKKYCMKNPQYCEKLCEYSSQDCYKFDKEEESNETLSTVDLVQRTPQDDPERENLDREDPEEEDPHPVKLSWCKRHPNHPFCRPPFSIDNLVQRAPQDDPEREDPEKEDPETEDPEEEDPHPVERSWCKKHPNHPYCYSPFCRDHPGSCKDGVQVTGAVKSSVEPALSSSSAVIDSNVFSKRDKKGGWYCFWLC